MPNITIVDRNITDPLIHDLNPPPFLPTTATARVF